MNICFKRYMLFFIFVGIGACEAQGDKPTTAQSNDAIASGNNSFTIKASNGIEISHGTKGAKVNWATQDSWSFSTGFVVGERMRLEAWRLGDEAQAQTKEVVRSNTGLSFSIPSDGKKTTISCQPAEGPVGIIERTALSSSHVSGKFKIELVSCVDSIGDPIEYNELPITVEGTFSVDLI